MKNSLIYIVALIGLSCSSLWAQNNGNTSVATSPIDTSATFTFVDEWAHFKEGQFDTFIAQNFIFSKEMSKTGKPGSLFVTFIVEKNGEVSNVRIMEGKGLTPIQDAEAIRVIQSTSGKWVPGKINGQPVRTVIKQRLNFDKEMF